MLPSAQKTASAPRSVSFRGLQRGPHAPCVRFAAEVTLAPRNTRFRLVASLRRAESIRRVPSRGFSNRLHHILLSQALPGAISAVSVPFSFRTSVEDPEAVLIATSSRLDHFRSPDQVEVLTVGALANMFSMLLSAGERTR